MTLRGLHLGMLLVVAASQLCALDPRKAISQYVLDHWQVKEGLLQSTVQAIAQTRDGYLWLGTRDGLVRFDGVRFTVFDSQSTPAITHNNIADLAADPDGGVWIASSEGGVIQLKGGDFRTLTTKDGLSTNSIRALHLAPDGSLWIGHFGGGVSQWKDGRAKVFTLSRDLAGNTVRALATAHDGGIWAGTDSGLHRIQDGRLSRPPEPFRMHGVVIHSLHDDPDTGLWVGTGETGLRRIQNGRVIQYSRRDGLAGDTVRGLWKDRDGILWIATTGGLNRFANGRLDRFTQADGLAHNYVRRLYEDREGSLWIGLFGGGLNRLKDSKFTNLTRAEGLSDEFVFTILESRDGSLWIGTQSGGLNRLKDGRIQVYTTRDGLSGNTVWSLAESRDGSLWVGTAGHGICRFRNGVFTRFTARDGIEGINFKQIAEAPDGSVWATSDTGLSRYAGGRWTNFRLEDSGAGRPVVSALHLNPDGTALAGGHLGLFRFEGGRFTPIHLGTGAPVERIHALHVDAAGVVWLATNGSGLLRLKDGRTTVYSTKDGLPDNIVYQILEDGDGLWMTSNRGIILAPKTQLEDFAAGRLKSVQCLLYGIADGMKSSECNGGGGGQPAGWRSRDGRLWFPTVRGVSVVDAKRFRTNSLPPPVVIESVISREQDFHSGGAARVPPSRGHFEVHYAGLSFLAPLQVRFRHRLEGWDRDWVEAGNRRSAHYTNLPPGKYRFRVKACNNDGVWNETGAECVIELQARYFQTVWFQALSFLAACLVLFGLFRSWERHVRAREAAVALRRATAELEERVRERTADLAQANQALRLTQFSVDHSAIPTFWIAGDGRIVRVNHAAREALGYSEDELLALRLTDLCPDCPPDKTQFDCQCRRKDGGTFPVEVSVSHFEFDGSEYSFVFVRDVSEHRRLEAQVQQMQKMQAVGTLVGGIAHEFNNLLTVVNGYAQLILDALVPADLLQKRVGEILKAGTRAAWLTAQLLAFSRKQVIRPEVLDLNRELEETAEMILRLIGEHIELRLRLEPDLPPVKLDRHQLRQILLNLAVNARDAMPDGGTLTIETSPARPASLDSEDFVPGDYVLLSVADTGCGMDERTRSRVFEPFFTTKEVGQGTGLGLSTVYGILKQNRGHIVVDSEAGQGSRFSIYLPPAAGSGPVQL